MWYPFLVQQEFLAEKKQAAFLLAESVLMAVPLAVSSVLGAFCLAFTADFSLTEDPSSRTG